MVALAWRGVVKSSNGSTGGNVKEMSDDEADDFFSSFSE